LNGLTWGAIKSVKSINPCKSLPTPRLRQTGVVQTSYDIVKAHGGELKVETKEGEGSEFVIILPIV
jgi:light-regulated signal transduction histidine kinase (bacteriophytochrome)